MPKFDFLLFFFVVIKISISEPNCKDRQKNCQKCNSLKDICAICTSDNYFPDNEGGCQPKCVFGKNFCNLCNEEETLCLSCEPGYYKDEIGGCSYTTNCKTSYKGKCLTCLDDFILIQQNGFCKSIHTEELKNCKTISNVNGTCVKCEEGFFLNEGDYKCTETEFCFESTYGVCNSCIDGYYIDKKNDKCVKSEIPNCKQTLDGINCDICKNEFYLTENHQCSEANMCSQSKNGQCMKCVDKYTLVLNNYCANDPNCQTADKDTAICLTCKKGFYLDDIKKKCISNKENDEYIYCKKASGSCVECEEGYFLGKDSLCTDTQFCVESEKGKCLECQEKYFLVDEGKCTSVEHCKVATGNNEAPCEQCEEGYYLNIQFYTCLKIENEIFNNCKKAQYFGNFCLECVNNYYNNRSDGLCYDNTDENDDFYKCATTDISGDICFECEKGYYIGEDRKCSKIENCRFSENANKCIECEQGYCLDAKNQVCVDSEYLEDVNIKIYLSCLRTNEEGTKCEKCLDGYVVGEEGYCIDVDHCEEKEGDICAKCKKIWPEHDDVHYYCYNSVFGCVRTYNRGCLKCENLTDLWECNECDEGFKLTEYGVCKEEY